MYATSITDYDNTTDYDNFTNDYNITDKCTINKNNSDRNIPTLLLTIPCGLSFLGLISLMIYTLIKPLITNE